MSTIDQLLQNRINLSIDSDQKEFLEHWEHIRVSVKKIEDVYMKIRSSKSTRILTLIQKFLFKFLPLVDFHLDEYKDIDWKLYVQVQIYHPEEQLKLYQTEHPC